jgi:hypothetical protein
MIDSRVSSFLGAFTELRKVTISLVMSIRKGGKVEIFGNNPNESKFYSGRN